MEPSTEAPSVQTSAATQADGLLPPKLMVLLPPKRLLLLSKLKLLMLSCPQFHLASKVSKIGIGNGRKKSIVWNHFEKNKGRRGCL